MNAVPHESRSKVSPIADPPGLEHRRAFSPPEAELGHGLPGPLRKVQNVVLMQHYLTGLLGALWGRPVSILTETTTAIESPTGNVHRLPPIQQARAWAGPFS
jgi:hypothetical protein